MDNNEANWPAFLKRLGLSISPAVVAEIIKRLEAGHPVNSLLTIRDRKGVAGKATIHKVRRLLHEGKLDSLRDWASNDPLNDPHIVGLYQYLTSDFTQGLRDVTRDLSVRHLIDEGIHPNNWPSGAPSPWERTLAAARLGHHLEEHRITSLVATWMEKTSQLFSSRKNHAILFLEQAARQTGLPVADPRDPADPGIQIHVIQESSRWANEQLTGREASAIDIQVVSGSRWPDHEAALVWRSPAMAVGSRQDMERALPVLAQLVNAWAEDRYVIEALNLRRQLDASVSELSSAIADFSPLELLGGHCTICN